MEAVGSGRKGALLREGGSEMFDDLHGRGSEVFHHSS